ncbi:MAG: hypothetical protein AAGD14_14875 [Planctomycetota bacterium]
MEEALLPESIRARASVSARGGHAWRLEDVPAVLEAARAAGLVCLGGKPRFRLDDATFEQYWSHVGGAQRENAESWGDFVDRSAALVDQHVRERCIPSTLREAAGGIRPLRESMRRDGIDPVEHVWLELSFATEESIDRPREPERVEPPRGPTPRERALQLLRENRAWAWYAVPPLSIPVGGVLLNWVFPGPSDWAWPLWFLIGLIVSSVVGLRVAFVDLGMPIPVRVCLVAWNLMPIALLAFVAIGWSTVGG